MAALVAARAPLALRASTSAPRTQRRSLAVRASTENEQETAAAKNVVFYKGNNFTEEEVRFAASEPQESLEIKPHGAAGGRPRNLCGAVWRVWPSPPPLPPPPAAAALEHSTRAHNLPPTCLPPTPAVEEGLCGGRQACCHPGLLSE